MISSNSSAEQTGEDMPEVVAPDPAPRPVRRTFTAAYRLSIVQEYEAAPRGEKGAVLRREGLYHSHIKEWTAARDAGAVSGLGGARRSSTASKGSTKGEVERLRAQNVRPRVSNDNPFSEAQFKTMKYLHDFPGSFATVQDARAFCDGFFAEYNHVFRHSGIGWHTPASVHFGTAAAIDDARQVTLNTAYAAHPERFARRPAPPQIPTQSWINQPQPELQNT